jgi:hypothetical protein
VKSVTSYDVSNVVVNEVKYEYNATGLLAKEYQNSSGSVVSASPYVGYTYDVTKSDDLFTKRLRLSTMKYPNGKVFHGVSSIGSAFPCLCFFPRPQ